MRRILFTLAALCFSIVPVLAQNPGIFATGAVTPGNCVKFGTSRTKVVDAGGPCGGGVASFNGRVGAVVPAASDYSFAQISGTLTPATQLPASGASAGTFGNATSCVTLTVTAQGIVTGASAATCTPAFTSLTGSIAIGQIPNGLITYAKLQNETANTVLGSIGATPPGELAVPSCSNALTWTTGVGFGCNTTSSPIIPPQGRLTLDSGSPVMKTSVALTSTIWYLPYVGNSVPYYDGAIDRFETFAFGGVGWNFVSAASAGQLVAGNVYDVFWVTTGTNKTCVAMSAAAGGGGGWATDTGGSNTARGSGYSAIDLTRGYWTNTNAITNCFHNAVNYGPVPAHQATYLGTVYTPANGQTAYIYGSNATGGGQAASLYLWNAYNRVEVCTSVSDSAASWNITDALVHSFHDDTGTRISFVTGQAEDGIPVQLFQQVLSPNATLYQIMAVGFAMDRSGNTTFDKVSITYVNSNAVAAVGNWQGVVNTNHNYNPQLGVHFIQALENQDGQATAWTGTYFGGIRTSFDACLRM